MDILEKWKMGCGKYIVKSGKIGGGVQRKYFSPLEDKLMEKWLRWSGVW